MSIEHYIYYFCVDINSTSPSTIPTDNQRIATSSATIPPSQGETGNKQSSVDSDSDPDLKRVATSSATIPPSLGKTGNKQNSVDSDSDPDLKIILIATVVPIVFLVILIVVVCFLCKHKKVTRKRNISKKGSAENRDSWSPKQFRHTDSCLRGADAYVNLPEMDTAQTFGAETNPGYRISDDQRVTPQEKPVYATPDTCRKRDNKGENLHKEPVEVKKKQTKDSSFHEVPGYETPDLERKETKRAYSHEVSGYETPDIERRANNDGTEDSAYATPDRDTGKEEHVDSGLSTADIKRVEVNGDLYALPDKKTRKINGLSYMDPSYLASGSQEKPAESDDQVGQPTEYADIVGVVKEKKKKKK
ncbi:uncharacterized protein LOC114530542 [Dendronephthya gigantea]|uniref:uncharacterized protein LOC114530542 n=1 Tax=Dendronephthya gigantea TaxID=151771 RepID=UPI00106C7668|nr:uncharacterized protein LOC114530542 [Dendronephthya gigantea]